MTTLKFTQKNPEPERNPLIDMYIDNDNVTIDSFDLLSDPMVVNMTVKGLDNQGNETWNPSSESYLQSDWTGEEISE